MAIRIRRAADKDWKTIQRLNAEVFVDNASYDTYLDVSYPFSPTGESYYHKVLSSRFHCCLIAEKDGVAVGYLIGKEKKLAYRKVTTAEIDNMGVSPSFRSMGIGAKLIQAFVSWCTRKKYETVYVNAYFGNEKARDFYEKAGFVPVDISFEKKVPQ